MTTIHHEYAYIGARNELTLSFSIGGTPIDVAGATSFNWALIGNGQTYDGTETNYQGLISAVTDPSSEVKIALGVLAERDSIPAGDYDLRLAMIENGYAKPFQLVHERGPFRMKVTLCVV